MSTNEWIAEFGGIRNGYFARNHFVSRDFEKNKSDFIKSCGNIDVYQSAYYYANKDIDSCEIIGSPYLDFDGDIETLDGWKKLTGEIKYVINYLEMELTISADELRIYFSGSKGFHIVIPEKLVGLKPAKNLNISFSYFAKGMAFIRTGKKIQVALKDLLDFRIYDRRRLFRIPNSINSKLGLYKVPVTIDQIYSFSLEQMLEWASKPREVSYPPIRFRSTVLEGFNKIVEVGKDFEALKEGKVRKKKRKVLDGEVRDLLPCAQNLLEKGVEKGRRNNSCFALSSSLLQTGHSLEEVYDMLSDWNDKNEESLSEKELTVTINSAVTSFEKGMTVGCGMYRDLDLCLNNCRLLQN